MSDIESTLSSQELQHKRDQEIKRILTSFKLDPYEILGLSHPNIDEPKITSMDIKKQYRSKSLLIHPDKTSNPDAPIAFSELKKAEQKLQDDESKSFIDDLYQQSIDFITSKLRTSNPSKIEIYEHFKDTLIHIEFKKIMNLQKISKQQGELAKLEEESKQLNLMKREFKKQWDETQVERVSNWRSYINGNEKKKKTKKPNTMRDDGDGKVTKPGKKKTSKKMKVLA